MVSLKGLKSKVERTVYGSPAEREAQRKRKAELKKVEQEAFHKESIKQAQKRGQMRAKGKSSGGEGFGSFVTKDMGRALLNVGFAESPFDQPRRKKSTRKKRK
jgi:hypothetical protein